MTDDVLCVRVSPNGKLLAASLLDSTVRVRQGTGERLRRGTPPHKQRSSVTHACSSVEYTRGTSALVHTPRVS